MYGAVIDVSFSVMDMPGMQLTVNCVIGFYLLEYNITWLQSQFLIKFRYFSWLTAMCELDAQQEVRAY